MKIHESTHGRHFVVIDVKCDGCGDSCKTEKGYEFMILQLKTFGKKISGHLCMICVTNKLNWINFKTETWAPPSS